MCGQIWYLSDLLHLPDGIFTLPVAFSVLGMYSNELNTNSTLQEQTYWNISHVVNTDDVHGPYTDTLWQLGSLFSPEIPVIEWHQLIWKFNNIWTWHWNVDFRIYSQILDSHQNLFFFLCVFYGIIKNYYNCTYMINVRVVIWCSLLHLSNKKHF